MPISRVRASKLAASRGEEASRAADAVQAMLSPKNPGELSLADSGTLMRIASSLIRLEGEISAVGSQIATALQQIADAMNVVHDNRRGKSEEPADPEEVVDVMFTYKGEQIRGRVTQVLLGSRARIISTKGRQFVVPLKELTEIVDGEYAKEDEEDYEEEEEGYGLAEEFRLAMADAAARRTDTAKRNTHSKMVAWQKVNGPVLDKMAQISHLGTVLSCVIGEGIWRIIRDDQQYKADLLDKPLQDFSVSDFDRLDGIGPTRAARAYAWLHPQT
jgi:hypothetical protein